MFIEVFQKDVDVIIVVRDPDGKQQREINTNIGIGGKERTSWITRQAGVWKVEIVASNILSDRETLARIGTSTASKRHS